MIRSLKYQWLILLLIGLNLQISATPLKVMTLNMRINKINGSLPLLPERIDKIRKLITHYSPDVIALQECEKDTWDAYVKGTFPDYHSTFWQRGGFFDADEGVAVLAKKTRFRYFDSRQEKTMSYSYYTGGPNRNIVRVQLTDIVDNTTIWVYSAHAPTPSNNWSQDDYLEVLADWARKFGDDKFVVMGDLNTGEKKNGNLDENYNDFNIDIGPHKNAYTEKHLIVDGGHHGTEDGHIPISRSTRKIDHIVIGTDYLVHNADIDRSVFVDGYFYDSNNGSGWKQEHHFNCVDENTYFYNNEADWVDCYDDYYNWIALEVYDGSVSYSDHWAVWAEIELSQASRTPPSGYGVMRRAAINDHNEQRHDNKTQQQCANLCSSYSWCKTFDYKIHYDRCYLSKESKTSPHLDTTSDSNGWDLYYKK